MTTDTIAFEELKLPDEELCSATRWGVRRGFLIALFVAVAWPFLIVCLIPFLVWTGFAGTRLRWRRRRAKAAAYYAFDPEDGIRNCVRRRTKPPGGVLPGTARYSGQRAESLLERDVAERASRSDQLSPAAVVDVDPEPGLFAVLDHVLISRVDRY